MISPLTQLDLLQMASTKPTVLITRNAHIAGSTVKTYFLSMAGLVMVLMMLLLLFFRNKPWLVEDASAEVAPSYTVVLVTPAFVVNLDFVEPIHHLQIIHQSPLPPPPPPHCTSHPTRR
jgi:hypothetical protein